MKRSMTNVAFGSSNRYQSLPEIDYVKNIDICVATPVRALISATLGDVYTEFLPFRKTLEIPIGTRLVLELQ